MRFAALPHRGVVAALPPTDIRVDLIHQRTKLDEWTWGYNGVPFAYSDNTTVTLNQNQGAGVFCLAFTAGALLG